YPSNEHSEPPTGTASRSCVVPSLCRERVMSRNTKRAAAALAGFDRMREAVRQISRLVVPEGLSGYDAAMNFDRTAVLFGHRMFLRNIIPGEFAADVDTSVTLFAPDPDRPGELIEGQDPRRLEALKATIQADGCI